MNVNELTIGQVRELQQLFGAIKEESNLIAEVGQKVFIRTVTHHYTGRVTKANKDWLELSEAAWIADDGRFNEFLRTGEANEVEPFVEPVRIPLGCILGVTEWKNALPNKVK